MAHRGATSSAVVSEASAREVGTWRRPGGKLVELGAHALRQDELLAILIGAGVPGRPALAIANAILDEYIGLHGVHRRATVDELTRIPGLGLKKAARIFAAIELGRRLHRLTAQPTTAHNTENDLFGPLRPVPHTDPQAEVPDVDLLAEIIGSGVRGRPSRVIAGDLLARFGSLVGLYGQDMGDFLTIKGLNSVKIIRIAAALEVAKRISHALS